MVRILIVVAFVGSIFLGCKTQQKGSVYVSPHTDTIKIKPSYSNDSLELFVKKIIVNDSLLNIVEESVDYFVQSAVQKDSVLFITVFGSNGCSTMDANLYQSKLLLKTAPPRIRVRLGRTAIGNCDEEKRGRQQIFIFAFDVRPLLVENNEVMLLFNASSPVVLKKW